MGGSGGRGFFRGRKPEEIKLDLRKEEEKTLDQAFDAQVAEHLGKFLSEANQRDTKAIRDALDEIKNALGADIEGTVDPTLGGSIRKRTYVYGISDIEKIINSQQPEALQLNGYHVESLAIESFKDYSGSINPKAMLEHFFNRSRALVLAPIHDKTGQSVHVDTYLGQANSNNRKEVS